MGLIDRSNFRPNAEIRGRDGSFTAGTWRFGGGLWTRSGDLERAWATCEVLVTLLVDRFDEVERAVIEWAPQIAHWCHEDISDDEVARRILKAMKETEEVGLNVGDAGWGCAYFDGPDFVLGHAIEVSVGEDGQGICVNLAG